MAARLSATSALALAFALVLSISACGSDSATGLTSPTSPAPPQTGASRVIRVSESLSFGDVEVGADGFRELSVCNEGIFPLAINRIRLPEGYWVAYDDIWEFGPSISPGACTLFRIVFSPIALKPYSGTAFVDGNHTSGVNAFQISGTGSRPPTPRTSFGEGLYIVGIGIAPGRYYSNPSGECAWTRLSTYPTSDHITLQQTWSSPAQWIVDILPPDAAFQSYDCGIWSQAPANAPAPGFIEPGMWEVRAQVPQGRYRTKAAAGCNWERLSNFEGTPSGVIESGSAERGGDIVVSIRSTDAGFVANDACGTWKRVS
jgi:hypothetical protein